MLDGECHAEASVELNPPQGERRFERLGILAWGGIYLQGVTEEPRGAVRLLECFLEEVVRFPCEDLRVGGALGGRARGGLHDGLARSRHGGGRAGRGEGDCEA